MARPVPMTVAVRGGPAGRWRFPVLHLRTGITDITAFPDTIDGVAGIKLLNEKWPQGTELTPRGRRDERRPGGHARRRSSGSRPRGSSSTGLSEPVEVTPSTRRQGRAGLVHDGRRPERRGQPAARPPGPDRARAGGLRRPARTSGRCVTRRRRVHASTSRKVYADGAPLIFVFVLGLSFLLMLVAFHSVVIPIKAILLNLLSTAAAYGVLVARLPERVASPGRSGSRRAGSSRAGSRCSSSRSCSGCRWTTTCSSSPGSRRRGTAGSTRARPSPRASR